MSLMELFTLLTVILMLLSLILDAVRLTVEVLEKFSQRKCDDNKKRLTATAFQLRAVNLDCKGRKLTIADSTFSICSIVIFCRFVKRRCPPSLFLSPFSCAFSPRKLWLFAQKLFVDTLFFQSYTYSNNIWFCFQL